MNIYLTLYTMWRVLFRICASSIEHAMLPAPLPTLPPSPVYIIHSMLYVIYYMLLYISMLYVIYYMLPTASPSFNASPVYIIHYTFYVICHILHAPHCLPDPPCQPCVHYITYIICYILYIICMRSSHLPPCVCDTYIRMYLCVCVCVYVCTYMLRPN